MNVGRVIRAHGLNGQLRVKSLSDVAQRYQPGGVVYINGTPFTITASGFFRHGQILLTLQGIEDSNAAQKLVEQWITVPVEAAPPLPEGEWFHFQLLGLRVITDQGEDLGKITDILETGSNDVYVVSGVKTEILIPALKTVITQVRLDEGVMLVSLPDGLR
ncbi:MAG: 16S rRNA processing protein RimM [SAR202 cluster bacterium Io17-Chloro-G2]|nr:MAG: 16S rRNA processing protein RimM [SAR202 cluster bacterium Io17-Chloro-G2]